MGIVNLFGDTTYDGGAAINGRRHAALGYRVRGTRHIVQGGRRGPSAEGRRNFAFGIFYTGYGVGWLIGSIATGLLYDLSVAAVIAFSMAVQLGSIPLLLFARRTESAA
jgi:hypothetical protein